MIEFVASFPPVHIRIKRGALGAMQQISEKIRRKAGDVGTWNAKLYSIALICLFLFRRERCDWNSFFEGKRRLEEPEFQTSLHCWEQSGKDENPNFPI
jgi:hypothetical protein